MREENAALVIQEERNRFARDLHDILGHSLTVVTVKAELAGRLLDVDPELFGEAAPHAAMKDVFEAMLPYIEAQLAQGARLHAMTRHFVGAFHGVPGARAFRRHLAENGVRPGNTEPPFRRYRFQSAGSILDAIRAFSPCT